VKEGDNRGKNGMIRRQEALGVNWGISQAFSAIIRET
jgi:hypothetical protein